MAAVQGPARAGARRDGPTGQRSARHSAADAQDVAARPVLDRGRGRLGRFGTGQVVAWQAAGAAVLVGRAAAGWWWWAGLGLAGAILVLTCTPVSGRWLYQWIAMRWRFWWRVPHPVTDPGADARLVPLREVLPDLDVRSADGRGGEQFGVVEDGRGWVALVAVHDDDLLAAPAAPTRLPVRALAEVLSVDDIRLVAVQVLLHTVPAPSGLLGGGVGPARSYLELSGGQVPATQLAWVALRLDPMLCPDAVAARGGGLEGVHRALRRCVARTVEVLAAAGVPARGLDAEEVRAALAASAGVAPRRPVSEHRHTGERWTAWTCDGMVHATYWLRRWPADVSRGVPALLDRLVALPVLFSSLSLTLVPGGPDQVRFRGLVRISCASSDAVRRAGTMVHRAASAAGFRAVRMDGEQGPAALATMPLGGAW